MGKIILALSLALIFVTVLALPVFAGDHLADAIAAPGAVVRGFGNPHEENPSGQFKFPDPDLVPGLGNPNTGSELGTPASDLTTVNELSGGHGNPVIH